MSTGRQKESPWWTPALAILCVFFMALAFFVILTGCGTVGTIAPTPVTTSQAGFTGNEPNGGFLGYLPADGMGQGHPGHLTAGAVARYNALILAGYGKGLVLPAIKPGDGLIRLSDGTYEIDDEHLVLFGQMDSAFRSGVKL